MHPVESVASLFRDRRDGETSSKFASTKEDLTEEGASDYQCQMLHRGAAVSHPKTPREPEAPGETKRLPRAEHEGAKMIAIDGPKINVKPRVLGEPPPTPLSQPKKVTADQTPGEQGPRQAGQRSPTHLDGKPALDTERRPPGAGGSGGRGPKEQPAVGPPGDEGVQQQKSPGVRASIGGSTREQELTVAETSGSKSFPQAEPPREKSRRDERSGFGTRGDDREKKNHYRDTMAVRTAMLGWGAAGGLLLLVWGDSLLLALLLGAFLTGPGLID